MADKDNGLKAAHCENVLMVFPKLGRDRVLPNNVLDRIAEERPDWFQVSTVVVYYSGALISAHLGVTTNNSGSNYLVAVNMCHIKNKTFGEKDATTNFLI